MLLTNTSRWKIILAASKRSPTLRRSSNSVAVVEGVPPHALALFKREKLHVNSTLKHALSAFEALATRYFSGVFHTPQKKPHFYGLFCDFSLRSPFTLAIVPCGPSFFAEHQG